MHTRAHTNAIIFSFFNHLHIYSQGLRSRGYSSRWLCAHTRHGTCFSSVFHKPPVDSLLTYVRERFSHLLRLSAHLCSLYVQTHRGHAFHPTYSTTSFVYIFHSRHTRKHLLSAVRLYRVQACQYYLFLSLTFYLSANLLFTCSYEYSYSFVLFFRSYLFTSHQLYLHDY